MSTPSQNILALLDLIERTPTPKTLDQARHSLGSITKTAATARASLAAESGSTAAASQLVAPRAASTGLGAAVAAALVAAAPRTLTESAFMALSPREKMKFSTGGGRIAETAPICPTVTAAGELTRAGFDALTAAQKMAFCTAGGRISAA